MVPIVQTTAGRVRGQVNNGVAAFKGVQFGAPTGGVGRFKPASPPAPWEDVRDALAWGPSAVQGGVFDTSTPAGAGFGKIAGAVFGGFKETPSRHKPSEDCLYLNVWTLSPERGGQRPVMVWLHGGGFGTGAGGSDLYDGTNLCNLGDVVVVTVNHRLSALGYLYLGEIDPAFAQSGNVGMLDIVLALQWVRDNIAAFGGDPGNVTIFGESGGGNKVSLLMAMPAAKGLFHKAVIQSATALRATEPEMATRIAKGTLEELGLNSSQLAELQQRDAREVIAAAHRAEAKLPQRRVGGLAVQGVSPVVDGVVLPTHPFDPVAPEISTDIPLMIGTCKEETTLFLAGDPKYGAFTEAEVTAEVETLVPSRGAAIVAAYKAAYPGASPSYQLVAITTARFWADSITLAERKLAQGRAPVFMYRLDWPSPVLDGLLRAVHSLDLPLMFNNVEMARSLVGSGAAPQAIADRMSRAWVNFARTGNPSQPGLTWPAYDLDRRATMIFDTASAVTDDPDSLARKAWA